MAERANIARKKDWVMHAMSIPVYAAFVWLGLIFTSHIQIAVFLFVAVGAFVDSLLVVQAARSVQERDGEIGRAALRRATLWRRSGLVATVIGSIIFVSV